MLGDADEIARQLATGVCLRMRDVARCVSEGRALFLPPSAASQQRAPAEAEPPSAAPQQQRTATPTAKLPPWLSARQTRSLREATLRLAQAASDLAGKGGGDDDLRSAAALAVREATAEAMAMAADAVERRKRDGYEGEQTRAQIARVLGGSKDGGASGTDGGDGDSGDGDDDDGALYARLFSAMLPRVASEALSLLPLPSRTTFDLAGYCAHPLATAAVTAEVATSLLTKGAAALLPLTIAAAAVSPSSSPPPLPSLLSSLMARLRAESMAALASAASTAACNAATMRCDATRLLLVSTEAPPRAPAATTANASPETASVAAAAAETLCGASLTLSATTHPALLEALRLLRGIGAALERELDLRLALPRTAVLCAYGDGGAAPTLPPNSGWPDSGAEIAISLVLPAAEAAVRAAAEPPPAATTQQAARSAADKEAGSDEGMSPDADGQRSQTVEARASDGARVASVAACAAAGGGGSVLLTLARQTRCVVLPVPAASPPAATLSASASASASVPPLSSRPPLLVLTLFAYSACRRASDGAIRFLGVDPKRVPS